MAKFATLFLSTILSVLFIVTASTKTEALTTYSAADVVKHNTTTDCWMSFSGNVYDLSSYLKSHDKYMDIRSWCGKDMTQDFMDKAGMGVDHKASSYSLLNAYIIGSLNTVATTVAPATVTPAVVAPTESHTEDEDLYSVEIEGDVMKTLTIKQIADMWGIDAETFLAQIISTYKFKNPYTINTVLGDMRVEYKFSPSQIKEIAEGIKTGEIAAVEVVNLKATPATSDTASKLAAGEPYNFGPIFFGTIIAYVASYLLAKSSFGLKHFTMPSFNFFWNTVLLICLIPSGIFGFYLILRYQFPALAQVDFDFLFWHVEGSIIFATISFAHLIQRIKQYILPVKLFSIKKTV